MKWHFLFFYLLFGSSLINCSANHDFESSNDLGTSASSPLSVNPNGFSTLDINHYPLNKLVCDPLGGGTIHHLQKGLKAELYYLRDDQPRYTELTSYFAHGVRSEQNLFFSQVHVPTRLFSMGFPTEDGGLVNRDDGKTLNEWFALRFTSVLSLGANDEEGHYQLALLSDDGSSLKIQKDGEWHVLVNNDSNHPTRMGCGGVIEMKHGKEHLIQLDYFQGPKHHIAIIPLWRKLVGADAEGDPLCGVTGNDVYFDYNNSSKPKKPYLDLISRGWKPLEANNYSLPQEALFNPCAEGEAPNISNFEVTDLLGGSIRASWNTDIPAASQVLYTDILSGEKILSISDNVLRTQHEIYLFNLIPGHTYQVQGVSISDTYGKALSAPALLTLSAPSF